MQPTHLQVLVVEDSPHAARLLSDLVRSDGHDVQVALDGPSALSCAERTPPDVALIDLSLPGMDGYEVAGALQHLRSDRRPLLVVVTGHTEDVWRERSHREGIDLHLTKPIEPFALQRVLRRFSEILTPPDGD